MASYYWIKLYHEILADPKMGRLPDNLWRRVIECFLMAGEINYEGGELKYKDVDVGAGTIYAIAFGAGDAVIKIQECGDGISVRATQGVLSIFPTVANQVYIESVPAEVGAQKKGDGR